MSYREFVVPADEDLEGILGARSHPLAGEKSTRVLSIATDEDDRIQLSYDIPGRSIKLELQSGGSPTVEIFREGATRLSVDSIDGITLIGVHFETDALVGDLEIRISSRITIGDQLLFS